MGFQPSLAVREYTVTVPGLARSEHGLRIAHVSDFHFKGWTRVLSEARSHLLASDYDLLLVTGDFSGLPQRWRHAAGMARRFFDGITPNLGTFAVLGNHDRARLADQSDPPFRWLRNESTRIELGGSPLHLAGVEQSIGERGDLTATFKDIPKGEPVVLLAHYPSTAFDLTPGRVQLQLSGHTHGGQICLPRLGCVFTNDRIPTQQARGLHKIAGTPVHVSAGLGVSGPIPFRVQCPAELTYITLWSVPHAAEHNVSVSRETRKTGPVMQLADRV